MMRSYITFWYFSRISAKVPPNRTVFFGDDLRKSPAASMSEILKWQNKNNISEHFLFGWLHENKTLFHYQTLELGRTTELGLGGTGEKRNAWCLKWAHAASTQTASAFFL